LASAARAHHARRDGDDVPSVFDRARQLQRVLPDGVELEGALLVARDVGPLRQVAGVCAFVQNGAAFVFIIDACCSTFGWEARRQQLAKEAGDEASEAYRKRGEEQDRLDAERKVKYGEDFL
jgi:hypothetical protein